MPENRNVGPNLLQLKQALGVANLRELAATAGVDRSTLSKIIGGQSKPTGSTIYRIARAFNLQPSDLLLDQNAFAQKLEGLNIQPGGVLIYSPGTIKNRHLIAKFSEFYRGNFELYNRSSIDDSKIIASHVRVSPDGRAGLDIEINHPSLSESGDYRFVTYHGIIFPLTGCIYLFAERQSDKSDKSEIVSMIFELPDMNSRHDLLLGKILGASERHGAIRAECFSCVLKRSIENGDWKKLINITVGVLDEKIVSRKIKSHI